MWKKLYTFKTYNNQGRAFLSMFDMIKNKGDKND